MTEQIEQPVEEKEVAAGNAEVKAEENPLLRKTEVTISGEALQKRVNELMKGYAKKARLPGFRPGHVPMSRVKAMYGLEAINEAFNAEVQVAVRELHASSTEEIAGYPEVRFLDEAQAAALNVDKMGDCKVELVYEVMPTPECPDLSDVLVKKYTCVVDEAAVEHTIDVMRQQRATFQKVEDRAAKEDDRVVVNYDATCEGQPFEGGKLDGMTVQLGRGQMLPDFENAIFGMKIGETKEFQVNFPADYFHKPLAGKVGDFKVTVTAIEEPQYPTIDDEFAKGLGVESLEAMKAEIKSNLELEVAARLAAKTREEFMAELDKKLTFRVPAAVVASYQTEMMEQFKASMKQRGMDKVPELPASMFAEQAAQRARNTLFFAHIVKTEGLSASEEEVRALAAKKSGLYEAPEEVLEYTLKNEQMRASVENEVIVEKIYDVLFAKSKVEEVAVAFNDVMAGKF